MQMTILIPAGTTMQQVSQTLTGQVKLSPAQVTIPCDRCVEAEPVRDLNGNAGFLVRTIIGSWFVARANVTF
jgi:hypothetical protein